MRLYILLAVSIFTLQAAAQVKSPLGMTSTEIADYQAFNKEVKVFDTYYNPAIQEYWISFISNKGNYEYRYFFDSSNTCIRYSIASSRTALEPLQRTIAVSDSLGYSFEYRCFIKVLNRPKHQSIIYSLWENN